MASVRAYMCLAALLSTVSSAAVNPRVDAANLRVGRGVHDPVVAAVAPLVNEIVGYIEEIGTGYKTTKVPVSYPTTWAAGGDTYAWNPYPTPTPSKPHKSHSTTTSPTTTSTSSTSTTSSSTSTTSSAAPTISCDASGYLIQDTTLYKVDLSTGNVVTVAQTVGDGSAINAIGFNVLDNYIYGRNDENQLLRIAGDGSIQVVETLSTTFGANVGDVDTDGYYWYGSGGTTYAQVDLQPGSPTYGNVLASGSMDSMGFSIADWVYIPLDPDYLYTIAVNPAGGSAMLKFSMSSKTWQTVASYPAVQATTWGAIYGRLDGTIFASDNGSGDIWAFSILNLTPPSISTNGPPSSLNDGARCVEALL
ncbi:hypothetical protein BX600DRAFT_442635 [Xylariales sp. PMI_506]|nr:hypothetical protein BX600DRAFT_442635 [Xylariales sp. PMI_506]